ncbi:MAG: outer membrane protein, partial [Hyphococcus sp.]
KTLQQLLCGFALGVMAGPALAQDFYVSGFGGVNVRADQNLTSDQNLALIAPYPRPELIPVLNGMRAVDPNSWASESFSYTDKPLFGGSIGAEFELLPFLDARAELEGSRRKTRFRSASGSTRLNGASFGNEFDGEFSAISGIVNILFAPRVNLPFRPYVGGGVGVARIESNIRSTRTNIGGGCLLALPGRTRVDALGFDSRDTSFVGQFIGGIEAPILSQLSVFADARYYKVHGDIRHDGEFGFNTTAICALPPGQVQFNAPVDGEYDEISVVAGFRLSF